MATVASQLKKHAKKLREEEKKKQEEIEASNKKWLEDKLAQAPKVAESIFNIWVSDIEKSGAILSQKYKGTFRTDSSSRLIHETVNKELETILKKNGFKIVESMQRYIPYQEDPEWGMDEHWTQEVKIEW